jgi:hypothetical protein
MSYHQICTSDFLDPSWAQGIYSTYAFTPGGAYNRDFRSRSPYYFQMLASLCSLADNSLTDTLIDFSTTLFISTNVLSEHVFNSQVNGSIDLFISSVTNAFVRTFSLLEDTTKGNSLISSEISSLSFRLVIDSTSTANDSTTWQITLRYKFYNKTCSCQITSKCIEQANVYTSTTPYTILFPVPGIFIGCYTFEAMLQSNLNFFYNQTNVDWLRTSINITESLIVTALDPLQPSRFQTNSPIGNIFEQMMIEQWTRNISYVNYYVQCRPIYCKYSYVQKNDALYIITIITALIGGLTSVLQMVIPRFVKLVRRFCFKNNQ